MAQIELKLSKAHPSTWPTVISTGSAAQPAAVPAGPSVQPPVPQKKDRRNWDRVVDDELIDDNKDPVSPAAKSPTARCADFRTPEVTPRSRSSSQSCTKMPTRTPVEQ